MGGTVGQTIGVVNARLLGVFTRVSTREYSTV